MIKYNTASPKVYNAEIQMKEKPDAYMDPVLEECYRMKAEFAAQFKSAQELYDYLKAG